MGHSHGWGEVKDMYQFFADNFTDRHLQARDIAIHLMGDTAWVEYNWRFDANCSTSPLSQPAVDISQESSADGSCKTDTEQGICSRIS
jgi:hypothetical protein